MCVFLPPPPATPHRQWRLSRRAPGPAPRHWRQTPAAAPDGLAARRHVAPRDHPPHTSTAPHPPGPPGTVQRRRAAPNKDGSGRARDGGGRVTWWLRASRAGPAGAGRHVPPPGGWGVGARAPASPPPAKPCPPPPPENPGRGKVGSSHPAAQKRPHPSAFSPLPPTRTHREQGQPVRPYLAGEVGAGSTPGGAATGAEDCMGDLPERGAAAAECRPRPRRLAIYPRGHAPARPAARARRGGNYRSRRAPRPPAAGRQGGAAVRGTPGSVVQGRAARPGACWEV